MEWLTTFNDLMTLLMVFFVLLFTMSSVDTKKLKDFQSALQSGLGVLGAGQLTGIGVLQVEPIGDLDAYASQKMYEQAEDGEKTDETESDNAGADGPADGRSEAGDDTAAQQPDTGSSATIQTIEAIEGVDAVASNKSIYITLGDRVLFPPGTATIHRKACAMLDKIAAVVRPLPNTLRVEGHTDDIPIHSGRFPTNWELSVKRSVNIVKYLIERGQIAPHRLSAAGYGASKPVFTNDTPQNRALNRRVEIILNMEENE